MNNEQFAQSNDRVQCVILAAGQGTRMKSEKPKVLHRIVGKPMVQYAIDSANSIGSLRPIVVIGHGAEQVKNTIGDRVDTVLQLPQLGTGHALLQARALAALE
jgi:bifunctional UDP-N-acetylglucosamine pyrophosphorylase/glucosamine-1-phosphate N-acetyltransferase